MSCLGHEIGGFQLLQKELHDLSEAYFSVLNKGGRKSVTTCLGEVIFTFIPELNIVSIEVREVPI